ncbi:UPF0481 protein At3g47200-like [Cornus florida]|uniref:UPF0481 protein At3g47200-like n=1 Tax=Cornus florida TaxID=4283 RepID=UPI0028A07F45|nr:UPF0481 protein At3g47200-like [Cornus florida]XP_059651125.1 UPF0481 protein At3g47200-like [Cornus florida]
MAKSNVELSSINFVEVELSHESGDELTADDNDEWIISILEETPNASSYKPLQKVPRELREKEQNKGFFDPIFISIGPYHHGNPELKEAEKLKTIVVRSFIAAYTNVEPREIYNKMLEVVSDARNCYLEGSTDAYDDVTFARMMLLDGCFLLTFMNRHGSAFNDLINHVGIAGFRGIVADISLLENQLPFLVLQALISSTSSPVGEWEESIENCMTSMYIDDNATWTERTYKHEKEQPLHLLALLRRRFIGLYTPADEQVSSSGKIYQDDGPCKLDDQPRPRCSFKKVIPCWPKRGHKESDPHKDLYDHSFRSATELKARGIHFRPSTTFSLTDFTFTSRFGYGLLTLPQLTFDWGTKYCLLNMMAYELSTLSGDEDMDVCSYIYFMNSLINGAEDVIELRTHNIIHNFYSTDEEVAKAFNSMAIGGRYHSFSGPTKDVSDGIQKHYNSRMKTWTAQLWNNYFSNPWSVVAFFAATFALVLTFIQTFFPR